MKAREIRDILNAEVLACERKLDREIAIACGADLMSDVLAYSKEDGMLLTGLVNTQVIRTAEMMDIKAIAFVRGKVPTPEVIELATEKGILVLATKYPMYTSCGMLYEKGLAGGGIH